MEAQELYAAIGQLIEDNPGRTMYVKTCQGFNVERVRSLDLPLSDGSSAIDIELVLGH